MRNKKINVVVSCEISTSFISYDDKRKDKKAISLIKRGIKEIVEDAYNLALYVEKSENGADIDDVTKRLKIKITNCEETLPLKRR